MKTKLKIGTLMKLAASSDLTNFKWTVNQLRDHVVRVAGNCRTKREAVEAMNRTAIRHEGIASGNGKNKMKQAFERNGKMVENTVGFFNAGLTQEGVEIAEQMERDGQTGHIESNLYWVSDDFDFDNQGAAGTARTAEKKST